MQTPPNSAIGDEKIPFFLYPWHQAGAIGVAVALFSMEGARQGA